MRISVSKKIDSDMMIVIDSDNMFWVLGRYGLSLQGIITEGRAEFLDWDEAYDQLDPREYIKYVEDLYENKWEVLKNKIYEK